MVANHNFHFVLAVSGFVITLLAIAGYYYAVARRSSRSRWEDLVSRLTWFDRNVIADVALDGSLEYSDGNQSTSPPNESSTPQEDGLDPAALWKMIGGMQGLEILEANSKVLIELACYLQRSYPEALPIAEQLRLDSRALQWHIGRLRGAAKNGNLEVSFPFYAQRAVSTYYHMTQRVLSLYEATNFAMLAKLHEAI